jgi:uncharacterized LabA/DUF88 family protein
MSNCYAILLDGGFVKQKLRRARTPLDAAAISALTDQIALLPCLAGMRLHRIYFYDAKPLEVVATVPLSGRPIDFRTTAAAIRNRQLQCALMREPFFALRFGEVLHEGWQLKKDVLQQSGPTVQISAEDIQPAIRQKGVDMRIGLDIASLALKRQAQVIVLVTADSDFIPAMKFARREGAQLFLITLGHGIRDGLREHADLVIEEFPLPAAMPVHDSNGFAYRALAGG